MILGIKEYDTLIIQRPWNIFGILIRIFTLSRVDHTATVKKKDGVLYIVEAKAFSKTRGYNFTKTLDQFIKEAKEGKYKVIITRNPNPPKDREERFLRILGNPYGYLSIVISHVIKALFFGIWIGNKSEKQVVCSEGDAYINGLRRWYSMTPKEMLYQNFTYVSSIGFKRLGFIRNN